MKGDDFFPVPGFSIIVICIKLSKVIQILANQTKPKQRINIDLVQPILESQF